jgi:acetyl-CoA carboxylase biotin carboxyl carrier protein
VDRVTPADETTTAATDAPSAADPTTDDQPAAAVRDAADVELLGLIDRLSALLERSDLSEIEVEAGATGLILRKPVESPIVPTSAMPSSGSPGAGGAPSSEDGTTSADGTSPADVRPSVKAPLTGIFYASPAPGSAPYVRVGGEIAVGQVIGLIEAMKLFNEIKSDLAGRVVRVVPESGTLVKAKQPLIEVEPL